MPRPWKRCAGSRTALRARRSGCTVRRGRAAVTCLQAACAEAGRSGRPAAYLPLAQLRADGPQLLDGFEQLALVALDDLDAIAGDAPFEAALFTLYNGLAEQRAQPRDRGRGQPRGDRGAPARPRIAPGGHRRCIASSRSRSPQQPDALRRRAERRGLELPDETLAFLTRRAPRDFATLCRMLDALDTASLAAQRRLTVPFVRDWLARGAA